MLLRPVCHSAVMLQQVQGGRVCVGMHACTHTTPPLLHALRHTPLVSRGCFRTLLTGHPPPRRLRLLRTCPLMRTCPVHAPGTAAASASKWGACCCPAITPVPASGVHAWLLPSWWTCACELPTHLAPCDATASSWVLCRENRCSHLGPHACLHAGGARVMPRPASMASL